MNCAYCKDISVCAVCGKGYAEAVRADAAAADADAKDAARYRALFKEETFAGDPIYPVVDFCRGNDVTKEQMDEALDERLAELAKGRQ